jgi:hypothetical protein
MQLSAWVKILVCFLEYFSFENKLNILFFIIFFYINIIKYLKSSKKINLKQIKNNIFFKKYF